ncbi:M20 peptidase aminoacylase family protein [Neobacillus novalis]|uniref:M20 peptidase aminoacylase family protein n=1 Tax=Neobacillus novalis TaxID=220687 RepID=A0AA95SAH7_9BACI|nr:M20 peptidase aminoacylase family protein [Neobacillus novalis]WHY83938.1 M20 peptidase aminoacylase family protein [Neobacillus novalis]
MINRINNWVAKHEETIKSTYHHLHSNAEVSWMEVETTKFLCSQLENLGIPYETFEKHTGVVGYWGNKEVGPIIGIRADMDALWQLVNGKWQANHSCGHDGHMTMVLHALTCLKEIGYEPKGLIKIIFQPAEESGNGAKAIIETGVISDLDYLLGLHVRPIQEMSFGVASPAIYHGATTLLRGEVKGVQAHGSRPNLGINVADSLAAIIQAVNSIKMDPTVSASAKVTMIKAGRDNLNIIPDFGEFGIDVRTDRNEDMVELIEKVRHAAITAGSFNFADVKVETVASMVAAKASPKIEEIVKEAIVEALGEDALVPAPNTPGGEDFHFYKMNYPKLQSTMVGLGTGLSPGLHHPDMSFNIDALINGVKILSLALIKVLSNQKEGFI